MDNINFPSAPAAAVMSVNENNLNGYMRKGNEKVEQFSPLQVFGFSVVSHTFPMVQLSRVFGLLPFGQSFGSAVYIYIVMALFTSFYFIAKLEEVRISLSGMQGSNQGADVINLLLSVLFGLPDLVCSQIHMAKQNSAGLELTFMFDEFKLDEYPVLFPRYLTPFGTLFMFLKTYLFIRFMGEGVEVTIASMAAQCFSFLVLMQFCTYMESLKAAMPEAPPKDPASAVDAVTSQHGLLKRAENANKLFAGQLFFICLRVMINTIIDLYEVFFFMKTSKPLGVCLFMLLLLWEMFLLGALTRSCQTLKRKADGWNKGLFKLILQHPELCSNEKLKMYVQKKPGLFFSACNFFSIGYPLVTSVIAAALTYFVILIQFSVIE